MFARQNLPLIVDGARPNPNLNDGPEWGATLGNAILVWRSGIGVDRHGNLIYAAAHDQTVRSLADILIHAGAVRAMELDINSYWIELHQLRRRRRAGSVEPAERHGTPRQPLPGSRRPRLLRRLRALKRRAPSAAQVGRGVRAPASSSSTAAWPVRARAKSRSARNARSTSTTPLAPPSARPQM